MRHSRPRRHRYRSGDRPFRRNGSQDLRMNTPGINNSFNAHQRKPFNRNGYNPEKLLEKYNSLAKEALSNGDKILSENYYQHADHFLRIIENKNAAANNSKEHLGSSSVKNNSDNKVNDPKSNQNTEEI